MHQLAPFGAFRQPLLLRALDQFVGVVAGERAQRRKQRRRQQPKKTPWHAPRGFTVLRLQCVSV